MVEKKWERGWLWLFISVLKRVMIQKNINAKVLLNANQNHFNSLAHLEPEENSNSKRGDCSLNRSRYAKQSIYMKPASYLLVICGKAISH